MASKLHSELRTKAIDIIQLFCGCRIIGATGHEREPGPEDPVRGVGFAKQTVKDSLTSWMSAHREAYFRDAATKQ